MNGKARVWILICLLAVAVIGVVSVPVLVFYGSRQPELYVGRTRIMVNSAQAPSSAKAAKLTVEDVLPLATSNTVIERLYETLQQLGLSVEPARLIQSLKVERVPNTQIIQIEVTSPNMDEAKTAADVVAAEARNRCWQLFNTTNDKRWRGLVTIDPAVVYPHKRPLVPASLSRMLAIPFFGGGGFILGVAAAWLCLRKPRSSPSA